MIRIDWLRSFSRSQSRLSRRQRRFLAARRRKCGSSPVPAVERLEERTLLAAPHPVDLGTLNGTTGVRLDGENIADFSGRSVHRAGDVNGDGFDDVIVGAYAADPNGNDSGSSYVVFGASGGFPAAIDLGSLDGTNGFRMDGVIPDDRSGRAVSKAGDVNGDGVDDLIVGAYLADPNLAGESGSSYVLFGDTNGFSSVINLGALTGTDGFRLDGVSTDDQSGRAVSGAGDLNGDGFDDLVVGAHRADPNANNEAGSAYVVFGAAGFLSSVDLSSLDGLIGFRLDGTQAGDQAGFSVSGAGDVNGDGFEDLLVGADLADPDGVTNSGAAYLLFGRSGGFASIIDLSSLDGTTGFRLDGESVDDYAGTSVSSAGDVNGDGFDDLIVGARGADPNGNNLAGSSYVVFGHSGTFASTLDLSALTGADGFRLDGATALDAAGFAVSGTGDVDGDGFDDLMIGAYGADYGGNQSGSSYVLFGQSGAFASIINLSTLTGTSGFRLDGVVAYDFSGYSVSGAGDFNGDGFDDLLVGADSADPNGMGEAGSSYVVFGGNFNGGVETQVGTGGPDFLNAGQGVGVDVLIGGLDGDVLTSDGGPDVLRGGEGDDVLAIPDDDFSGTRRLSGGTGFDTLQFDGIGATLDLTGIADNRITGVEQIDLTGNNNRLIVSRGDVLRLSGSSNTLNVTGTAADRVFVNSAGWVSQGVVNIGGTDFNQYTNGQATLNVQTGVGVTFAAINLSTLTGPNGFRLDGHTVGSWTGFSVSEAGDVNGDGFDDVIVGAWLADLNGNNSGSSYVVFGRSGGFNSAINLSTLNGTTGFRLDGAAADNRSGISVSGAGDVNGDGFADLIVGADGAGSYAGSSYVVFGHSGAFNSVIDVGTLSSTDGFRLEGVTAGDRSGISVSGAGDVNGDGFGDLIVGAFNASPNSNVLSGSSYVVFGKSGGFNSVISLSSLDGTTGFRLDGVAIRDYSGTAVTAAGDVNGDGFDDLIVGADGADPNGLGEEGSSYVVFGRSGTFSSIINLSTLDGTNGFRLDGVNMTDESGSAVGSAGDVNGDGFDDLIIGAYRADPTGSYSGSSYVVFGQSGAFSSIVDLGTINGTTGFRIDGAQNNNYAGISVGSAGDVNGDGFDDLLIGANGVASNGNYSGSSYLLFGHSGGFDSTINLSSLDGTTGFRLDGVAASDYSGRSVSGAGDVNGDGFDDLIVGAYGADPNGYAQAGSSYVVFGGNFTGGPETQVAGDGSQTLNATLGGTIDVLIGGRGDDTLISDGGDDVLRGGEGDDVLAIPDVNFSPRRLVGGTGTDTLRLDAAGVTLDLSLIADNRLLGIEEIDVSGSGANELAVTAHEVLRLSDSSNTLTVRGGNDDRVLVGGSAWTSQGVVNIGGTNFNQYVSGEATLNVQTDMGVSFAVVGLSTLDGTSGFRIDGAAALDLSGFSVSDAGDVNGDGFEDVLVGAWGADPNGNYSGSAYVVFGQSGGFASAVDLSSLNGTTGFRLDGVAAYDRAGASVHGAGDVNGDGFDDLIVGASGTDSQGNYTGSSYVVFGSSAAFASAIELSSLDGTSGFRLDGVAMLDVAGYAVSGAGDVNGDGFHDLLIGAYGADPNGDASGSSYVVFGNSGGFASVVSLSTLDGTTGFRLDGVAMSDTSGFAVSSAGDFNGDGFDDLIVAATGADFGGNESGSSYVVFGKSGGFNSTINLSTLDGTTGLRLDGVSADDTLGQSVSAAGDVNGDGFDDLIVGTSNADPNGNASGSSYVVFGRSDSGVSVMSLSTLSGGDGFRLDGVAADDQSGRAVSGAGDVNGDGFDDLIVGANGADPNGAGSGSSYVFYGKSSGFASVVNLSTLNGVNGFRIDGAAMGDYSGRSVSAAGDVNGDGFDDLLVGASSAQPNGANSGSSYVLFGGNFTGGPETQVAGDGSQTLNATLGAGVDRLVGGRGDDTLVSDGGDDVLRGGEGDDVLAIPDVNFSPRRIVGGTGTDQLRLDGAGLTLDLAAIADNRITGIEEVNIAGSGANRLIVSQREVLRLSDTSNTLTVRGGSDDHVFAGGEAWTSQGVVNIGGTNFNQYTSGAATLNIQVGVKLTFAVINVSTLNGTTGFRLDGAAAYDQSGRAVSGAGDVNGDGFEDLIVGADLVNSNGSHSGSSYVVFGRSGGFPSSINLGTLNGTNGFQLAGAATDDQFGYSVSRAGDVNGDGFDDLIVGAVRAGVSGHESGASYVLFGRSGGFNSVIDLSSLNGTTGFRLDGASAGDHSGRFVGGTGDVNGDGFDDLIVGATETEPNGILRAGSSYVVFGRSGGFPSALSLGTLNGTTGFRLVGVAAFDRSGFSVNDTGDVNGDGIQDIILGAPGATPTATIPDQATSFLVVRKGSPQPSA